MNISEANKMVAALLDEEALDEYEEQVHGYYNTAQNQIATTVAPITVFFDLVFEKKSQIDLVKYIKNEFSREVYRVKRILSDSDYERVYKDEFIFSPGRYRVYCDVYPEKITLSTSKETEFEVVAEAHAAVCYFAAAQCVVNDSDLRRYHYFMEQYNGILMNISDARSRSVSIKVVNLGG